MRFKCFNEFCHSLKILNTVILESAAPFKLRKGKTRPGQETKKSSTCLSPAEKSSKKFCTTIAVNLTLKCEIKSRPERPRYKPSLVALRRRQERP